MWLLQNSIIHFFLFFTRNVVQVNALQVSEVYIIFVHNYSSYFVDNLEGFFFASRYSQQKHICVITTIHYHVPHQRTCRSWLGCHAVLPPLNSRANNLIARVYCSFEYKIGIFFNSQRPVFKAARSLAIFIRYIHDSQTFHQIERAQSHVRISPRFLGCAEIWPPR